jgi:hypothetical protein
MIMIMIMIMMVVLSYHRDPARPGASQPGQQGPGQAREPPGGEERALGAVLARRAPARRVTDHWHGSEPEPA